MCVVVVVVAVVVVFVHWHCSAQFSMFYMEKRYRNKIIIITTHYDKDFYLTLTTTLQHLPLSLYKRHFTTETSRHVCVTTTFKQTSISL